jgi:hypothetical protein
VPGQRVVWLDAVAHAQGKSRRRHRERPAHHCRKVCGICGNRADAGRASTSPSNAAEASCCPSSARASDDETRPITAYSGAPAPRDVDSSQSSDSAAVSPCAESPPCGLAPRG